MKIEVQISDVSEFDRVVLDRILISYNHFHALDPLDTVEEVLSVLLNDSALQSARSAEVADRVSGLAAVADKLSAADAATVAEVVGKYQV